MFLTPNEVCLKFEVTANLNVDTALIWPKHFPCMFLYMAFKMKKSQVYVPDLNI